PNEIGRQLRQAIVLALRPAIFDRHILPLDITALSEALPERSHEFGPLGGRGGVKESDHRHRRLLRARRERPRGCRAAEQRDELAAFELSAHSITSSARSRIAVGSSMPIALAVFRFTTISNLVGCSIGKSAGLAPRAIRSTNSATRPNSAVMLGP